MTPNSIKKPFYNMCKGSWCTCIISSVLHNQWNTMCCKDVCACVCVYLQSWIDGEAASSGVHAGHVLNVVYILQKQFSTVIPESTRTKNREKKKTSI